MKLNDFFSQHPIFTLDELDRFLMDKGSNNHLTRHSLISYYRKKGRIVSVKRGVYAVIQPGMLPESSPVDPYLLAGKMTQDAVLAYHTALEFYGKAYSVFHHFFYVSARPSVKINFRDYEFRCVKVPIVLQKKGHENVGVETHERSGISIRVTGLERTMVDVLNRPELSGSWEELWRSLEMVEFFDLEQVVEYVGLLENATTAAKVGFFLEQHRDALMVDDTYLKVLKDLTPKKPHYLSRNHQGPGRLISEWNLVVPQDIIDRTWGSVL